VLGEAEDGALFDEGLSSGAPSCMGRIELVVELLERRGVGLGLREEAEPRDELDAVIDAGRRVGADTVFSHMYLPNG
jgi:hypothetical protein